MIDFQPPFRRAELKDAAALAELVNFAGEGMPFHLWDTLKQPGETVWDVGRRRAEREEGGFSYRNGIIAEIEGRCAACMIGYPQPAEPKPIDYAGLPPIVVPLLELENLAPDTWYLNVLATLPDYRGRGLGTQFLALAERLARDTGKRGLSLVVSDGNDGAYRLYIRCGYREAGARPILKNGWNTQGRNWVLMTKGV